MTPSQLQRQYLALICEQQGHLSLVQVAQLQQQLGTSLAQTQKWLLETAKQLAQPAISNFRVAAIVVGAPENQPLGYYFGVNIEFAGLGLEQVVHAEQSAIHNAWLAGVTHFEQIIISAAPCGHCRQFMNELPQSKSLKIEINQQSTNLSALLPHAFGPQDLGIDSNAFNHVQQFTLPAHVANTQNEDYYALLTQLNLSYAPYSGGYSAAEIISTNNQRFYGRYFENAAYNPSLAPLQGAISQLVLAGQTPDKHSIKAINLMQVQSDKNAQSAFENLTTLLGIDGEKKTITHIV